ncbi:post-GPI attachment to proteins factor 2-like [Clytia hemisphaerica]|uniref:CWH43-like N-terminal domain-containing protein n=1 Tax=Clytia hemisphaerica TaxID=252671 RepID=A0A7M5XDZ3_9CNID
MSQSIKISLPLLINIAVFLPAFGIISCVILSIWYHPHLVTSTHCKVKNFLPSISSASHLPPEIYVWRTCIGIHSGCRYLFGYICYRFYMNAASSSTIPYIRILIKLNFICKWTEVTSLVLLSVISSEDNYDYHALSFENFIVCALLHMLMTCYIFFKLGEVRYNQKNYRSLRMKIILFLSSILSLMLLGYFFWRHNTYCEPNVYSLFAFFEYVFVFCNIGFHWTCCYDFQDVHLEALVQGFQYTGLKKSTLDL